MTSMPANQPIPVVEPKHTVRSTKTRMKKNAGFQFICILATVFAVMILVVLLASILIQGVGALSWEFITNLNSSNPHKAGIWTSLFGTIMICAICALSAIPLGVGTAVLIEEFKPKNKALLWIHGLIDTNIRNLAGVPSIVYGILGVTAFATMFGLFGPMGSGDTAVGITWFDQYQAEDKRVYYTPRKGSLKNDPGLPAASPEMTLYKSTDLKEEATNLTWVDEEDIVPRVEAIEKDMDEFEGAFRDEISKLRTGARNRGPVLVNAQQADAAVVTAIMAGDWKLDSMDEFTDAFREQITRLRESAGVPEGKPAPDTDTDIDPAPSTQPRGTGNTNNAGGAGQSAGPAIAIDEDQARDLAAEAVEAGVWQNPDTEEFEQGLMDLLLSLNGQTRLDTDEVVAQARKLAVLSEKHELRNQLNELTLGLNEVDGVPLIQARRTAISFAVDSEYAARMPDTMRIGKEPIRVDRKAWYHFSLPFGRGVLAGGLTLMLVILPVVIVASQEALRAVPSSYRQAALAMGATRWQAVSKTALPAAIPGICTGTILAISRAIGEAAPILVLGGTGFISSTPQNLMDKFSAMPMTIFQWTKEPEAYFKNIAAAGIIVLLIVLLSFNAIAIYIRHRAGKHH